MTWLRYLKQCNLVLCPAGYASPKTWWSEWTPWGRIEPWPLWRRRRDMHAWEAAAEERSERAGTRSHACPEQGVLSPEDNVAVGACRHQAVQIGHTTPRHQLHRAPQGHPHGRGGWVGSHSPSEPGESWNSTLVYHARDISFRNFDPLTGFVSCLRESTWHTLHSSLSTLAFQSHKLKAYVNTALT